MKLLIASLACSSLAGTAYAAGEGTFFSYFESGGFGPSNWQFLDMDDNQCGSTKGQSGYGQSPVTISAEVDGTCQTDMSAYDFMGGDCRWDQLSFTVSNNGVKVEPKAECSFGSMKIPHTPNKFNALHLRVRTFSGHQIIGQGREGFYPAELQVVHQEENEESLAVLGTMIDVGEEAHPTFELFLRGWEAVHQKVQNECADGNVHNVRRKLAEVPFVPIQQVLECPAIGTTNFTTPASFPFFQSPNIYDLPTNKDFGVYTYKGGLTTPPCTEAVNWNVLDTPMIISQQQMSRLEALVLCYVQKDLDFQSGAVQCYFGTVADEKGSTSRPPQPLMGRQVIHRCRDGPAEVIDDVGQEPVADAEFVKPPPPAEDDNARSSSCGTGIYKDCSEDPRSNPKASPNLRANVPSWSDAHGTWVGTLKAYDSAGNVLEETFGSNFVRNSLPYSRDNVLFFVNKTVHETRYYEHIYMVFQPASETFCSIAPPKGSKNTLGVEGSCGKSGYALLSEKFGTATFDKDGTVMIVDGNGRYAGATGGKVFPVDDAIFYSQVGSSEFEITETFAFTNEARTQITGNGQYLVFSDTPPYSENPVAESFTFVLEQVSGFTFEIMLNRAYEQANVDLVNRHAARITGDKFCVSKTDCPTEETMAAHDPAIQESPYDEEPQVVGGYIALFVILGVIALCIVGYMFHSHQVAEQKKRIQAQFAKRVAETMRFAGSHEGLSPQHLQKEFKKIDSDGNGSLDKDEMYSFMGGKLSDSDFEAMFIAMDADGNGTVEFAEFCSFLANMTAAFDNAQQTTDKSNIRASVVAPPTAIAEDLKDKKSGSDSGADAADVDA